MNLTHSSNRVYPTIEDKDLDLILGGFAPSGRWDMEASVEKTREGTSGSVGGSYKKGNVEVTGSVSTTDGKHYEGKVGGRITWGGKGKNKTKKYV
jgi:hypothetical protein